jgi:hypothetical protein
MLEIQNNKDCRYALSVLGLKEWPRPGAPETSSSPQDGARLAVSSQAAVRFWWRAWTTPTAVAVICLIASACLYYPGFMSGDSFTQYRQMKGIEGLSNIHPAALVYVWRVLDQVIPGPGGLFLFHLAVYWAAVLVFAIAMWRRPMARVAGVLLLGLFPPTFMVSLHIWKDASMVSCSLLAVALLTWHSRKPRLWLLIASGRAASLWRTT